MKLSYSINSQVPDSCKKCIGSGIPCGGGVRFSNGSIGTSCNPYCLPEGYTECCGCNMVNDVTTCIGCPKSSKCHKNEGKTDAEINSPLQYWCVSSAFKLVDNNNKNDVSSNNKLKIMEDNNNNNNYKLNYSTSLLPSLHHQMNNNNNGNNNNFNNNKMIQDYHILELVGEGSFGKVYKCRKKYTSQIFAIKVISKKGKLEKDIKGLRQEINILRTLSHPNIIHLFDAIETKDDFYVVTEFATGELYQIMEEEKGVLPLGLIQSLCYQLVHALHYLHSNKVIHRDIKPQNILIGSGGQVKLCDFGFAKTISSTTVMLTSIKGTPLYLAPEVVQELPYDHRADLWSLGVIIYELSAGAPPFCTNNISSLVQLIVQEPLKLPESVPQNSHLASLFYGLLCKDPEKRLNWPNLLNHPFISSFDISNLNLYTISKSNKINSNSNNSKNSNSGNQNSTEVDSTIFSFRKPPSLSLLGRPPTPILSSNNNHNLISSPKSPPNKDSVNTSFQKFQQQTPTTTPNRGSSFNSIPTTPVLSRPLTPIVLKPSTPNSKISPKSLQFIPQGIKSGFPQSPYNYHPQQQQSHHYHHSQQQSPVVNNNNTNNNNNINNNNSPSIMGGFQSDLEDIDSNNNNDGIETSEFWLFNEVSSLNESNATKLRRDRLFMIKLFNHLMVACTIQIEILPVGSILRTFSNILQLSRYQPATPLHQAMSPPPTPPNNYSSSFLPNSPPPLSSSSSNNNNNYNSNQSHQNQNNDLIYRSNHFGVLVNVLSNILSMTFSNNMILGGMINSGNNDFNPIANLVDCLNSLSIFIETAPTLSILLSPHQTPPSPQPPPSSSNSNNSNSNGVGSGSTITLFLSIVGETPLILSDVYKKILENTDIIPNLCMYLQFLIKDGCTTEKDLLPIIHCQVSFLFSSPTNILDFPLGSKSNSSNLSNPSSVLIYQTACNIMGDCISNESIIHTLYQSLENQTLRGSILQLLLHSCRASRVLIETIHKSEQNICIYNTIQKQQQKATTSPEQGEEQIPKSLFFYLLEDPVGSDSYQQSLILLLLGTILVHIPDSIDWMIKYDLVELINRFFCNPDHRVSSSASYFIGSFLTEAINFEKNYIMSSTEQLISTIDTVSSTIPIKNIRRLLGSKRADGQTMREYEGGCFGRPYLGLLDGCACMLLRLLKRGGYDFLETMLESGIWEAVCHQINNTTGEIELSPSGIIYALRVIYEVLSCKNTTHIDYLVKNNLLISLCNLLQPSHLDRLKEWPSIQSGGSGGVTALVTQIICILYLPLRVAKDAIDDSLLELIRHIMIGHELIHNIILLLPQLPLESLELPLGLLSNLILEDTQFCQQFIEFGGLDPQNINLLLNTEKNSVVLIVDTLMILSQLARISVDNYKAIHKSDIYIWLKKLLDHYDSNVRSKTCNLIGNLFKYNSYFYRPIQKSGVLPILISRCSDTDLNTRKFACFALGNAAFHSDELYDDLEESIEPLNQILANEEEDEKTRSNVVGAIGNLNVKRFS
eukprot:gene5629-7004_t